MRSTTLMHAALAILLCVAACNSEAAPTASAAKPAVKPALPTGSVRFETPSGPWVVKVEIVSDDASRQRGLMFRRDLPPNTGMLFVFQSSEDHNFWMHNTTVLRLTWWRRAMASSLCPASESKRNAARRVRRFSSVRDLRIDSSLRTSCSLNWSALRFLGKGMAH